MSGCSLWPIAAAAAAARSCIFHSTNSRGPFEIISHAAVAHQMPLLLLLLLHPDYIQWGREFMWFGQSIYYIASQFRRCQLRTKYPICVYEFYFDYKTTANYDDVLWNIQWKRLTGFLQLPLSLPFPIIIRSNLPACRNPFPADIAHALPTAVLFAVLVRL